MLYIIAFVLCIINPEKTIEITNNTIGLWAKNVLPIMFPIFFISKMILAKNGDKIFEKLLFPITKLLCLPRDSAYLIFLTLFCGFPTASKIVYDKYNGTHEYFYFASLCFSASPVFILGTVAIMLGNKGKALSLLVINLCVFFVNAVLFRPKEFNDTKQVKINVEPMNDSIQAIFTICGYMIVFSLFYGMLAEKIKNPFINGFISGLLELTLGLKNIADYGFLPIISFFISFGGLCAIFQCLSFLRKINKVKFILYRLLSGIMGFFLCVLYEKTNLFLPLLITATVIVLGYVRISYFLKSSKS